VNKWDFQRRTKALAIAIIHMTEELLQATAGSVVSRQIIRCATSVGANYRAACRAKSTAYHIYKLKIVEKEADETHYWLEIAEEAGLLKSERLAELKREVNEFVAMTVASIKIQKNK
jgi:four helix bundle protein